MKTFIASLLFAAVVSAQEAEAEAETETTTEEETEAEAEETTAIKEVFANAEVTADKGKFTSGGSLTLTPPAEDGKQGSLVYAGTITWDEALDPATRWTAYSWLSVKSDDRDFADNMACAVGGEKGAKPTVAATVATCGVYNDKKEENPPEVEETEEETPEETSEASAEEEDEPEEEAKTCQPWTIDATKTTVKDMTATCSAERDVPGLATHKGSVEWKVEGHTGYTGFTYKNTPPATAPEDAPNGIPDGGAVGASWDVNFGSDSAAMLASASVAIAAVLSF